MATETYQLSIQGSVNGQYNECVIAFQSTGLSTTDTLAGGADLISAFIAHGQALWLAMFPNSYFLDVLQTRRAFPKPSGMAHTQNQVFSVFGSRGTDATSYNLCPAVFLIPPMGTKTGGRVFLPCVGSGDIVNNSYITSYATAVDNFFAAAITGFAGSGTTWHLAVFSRKNVSASLVAAFSRSTRLGFQGKRRKPTGSA
jgi:hypothetical protein